MSPRKLKTDPEIIQMPSQQMAVVHARGRPDQVFSEMMPALFGSVYTLKFDRKKKGLADFKVGCPRSRYPDVLEVPKEQWTIVTGVPVPEDVTSLPQKVPDVEVHLEAWHYGMVAQILHLGAYDQEKPTIERLQQFISESGYEIAGAHEEEYCSRPEAKVIKTIIRYPVIKKDKA